MSIITSNAHFRQRVVKYSNKYGVAATSIRFQRSRQAIYEWQKKYDGESWKSLPDRSHRPHNHPNRHTQEGKDMIMRYWKHNKDDRIVLWEKLRNKGYTRAYNSMNRVLRKWLSDEEKRGEKAKSQCRIKGQNIQDRKYR